MKENNEQGFRIPRVLLPAENVNLAKWACIACDQFTSQPDYWRAVERFVGNVPSTPAHHAPGDLSGGSTG